MFQQMFQQYLNLIINENEPLKIPGNLDYIINVFLYKCILPASWSRSIWDEGWDIGMLKYLCHF